MFNCQRCERDFNLLGRDTQGNECCPFCGSRHIVVAQEDEEGE